MIAKKAIGAYDIVYWIVRILFVLMMFFFLYFLARVYETRTVDTSENEARIFIMYMAYNPDAFSYRDTTNRVYPGIVDVSKMTPEMLEQAMHYEKENRMIAANITLYQADKTTTVRNVFYNEREYWTWAPLSLPTFTGEGTVRNVSDIRYVLYKEGDSEDFKPGFLKFDVLVPKS